jgi:mycothiol synthase
MAVTSRPYSGEEDYARMRALLTDIYATGGPPVYCTVGDLDWWRHTTGETPDAATLARLWFGASGALVGFAWPGGDQVDLLVHPHHRAIEGEMLGWAERRRREQVAGEGGPPGLTAWAFEGDGERTDLLRRRGYERGETFLHYRLRGMDGPLPAPSLPPGYALRHVRGETDLERRVAVHRDAFAPSQMTVAKHLAVMGAPTYRPELDLVAVAPDGSFAAYCIAWFDAANRLGVFEPVGCHSAHRRLGLATAVMREGLRRLAALGARTASVNSASGPASEAANRLYDSLGFAVLDRNRAWTKVLSAEC